MYGSLPQFLVLEVYRITLLSNHFVFSKQKNESFRGLQNYTTLKQMLIDLGASPGFRGLQNYTTLKPIKIC